MEGAIDGVRTRDIQDHNLALYQLSYDRREVVVSTRLCASLQGPGKWLEPQTSLQSSSGSIVVKFTV